MKALKTITGVEWTRTTEFNPFIYLPETYSPDRQEPWPAVLFLHGKSELGKEYVTLPDGGLHNFVELNALPLVVLEPQCPADSEWVFQLEALMEFLGVMTKEYNLDTTRLYLIGLSMGGVGAWHLGIQYPDVFAAILPISGGTYPFLGYPEAVRKLKAVPVWAFHGLEDDILPVGLTKVLVEILEGEHAAVRHTYYENTKHDAWTPTYTNKEVYEWLLDQRKDRP